MLDAYEHNALYVRAQFLISIFDSNFIQNENGMIKFVWFKQVVSSQYINGSKNEVSGLESLGKMNN